MARRPIVRLPMPPTTGDIAKAFRRTGQAVRRNPHLVRLSQVDGYLGELMYTPESVEVYAQVYGMTVEWVDPRTGDVIADPYNRQAKAVSA